MKNYYTTLNTYKNNKWYSVIIALFTVWFMLVISTTVFNLVLNETFDTNWLTKYLQAFNWAEWAMELWLLDLKKHSYWYEKQISHSINSWSILLADNPLNLWLFNKKKDVFISYDLKSRTNNINSIIEPWRYYIVPLFYTDNLWNIIKIQNSIDFSVLSWNESNLWWNIVWNNAWISWVWNFNELSIWKEKVYNLWEFNFWTKVVNDFLASSNDNYLILFNSDPNNNISFNLSTSWVWEFFSNWIVDIISSWEIWDYKQNLRVKIDNWSYLNLLKYSIFSN